ncbi:MAG: NADH-quinone oxidoreductase subunit N [bacterium]|nr:NADH-quinone oxidoreductase subunit N [Candidatus Sumerlaeota bacterium]
MSQLATLAPDIIMAFGGTLVLLLGTRRSDKAVNDFLRWLSVIIIGGAALALAYTRPNSLPAAEGWIISSSINIVFGVIFLAILAWTVLAAKAPEHAAGEWHALLIYAGNGMLILARSGSLAALFLGIEILSLSLYVLISFFCHRGMALRGGTMYLVLAAFASAFLVFGLALVYASFGTLDLAELAQRVSSKGLFHAPMAMLGFGLFIVGVGFKLAAVPFHMWAADVYEASPGPVAGLIASASKGAVIAAFIPFLFLVNTHGDILWLISAASMIVGNLMGLLELRVKRILAYSSIAHIGYILVGYLAGYNGVGITGVGAMIFYVVAYALAIAGAFTALSFIERDHELGVRDLRGVARVSPALAFCILVFIISLAGIPPAIGFFGKLYLFSAGVSAGYIWLPVLGLLGSAIGVYYYLRIIVNLYMTPGENPNLKISYTPLQISIIIATAAAIVFFGCFPQTMITALKLF